MEATTSSLGPPRALAQAPGRAERDRLDRELGVNESDLPKGGARPGFSISDWAAYEKNTLRGFFTVETPSGLVIHGMTLHVKAGARWVSMPAREYAKADGTKSWSPVLEFANRAAADRFRDECLAALAQAGIGAAL